MAFITRAEAKQKIEAILREQQPVKTGQTLPIRSGMTFNVYLIPVEYLAPNVLNDRIAWKIREFEAEKGRRLSPNNQEDVEFVYQLIENETPKENEKTLKDLAEKGQQVDGIITKDGIIIDGNRRATLLRKLFKGAATRFNKNLEDFRFFKAIVLSEDIDEKEIMALETRIQIGEDKKLDYNPICLYIKVDNLSAAEYNDQQIANYMNISESEVKERREIFRLMNEYLEAIGKPNHYTLLEGLEDQFINTKTVFKRMDNGTYAAYDWEYTDEDVANFKQVCYDYLRAKFEGKKYRDVLIGKPNKTNGVFIKKSVWDEFLANHERIVESNDPQNEKDWEALGKKQFAANLKNASDKLDDVLNEKNVTSLVNTILCKVKSLTECLEGDGELSEEDYKNLKEANSDLWQILKDYK
ncbi:MAG: hypothetical protein SOT51_00285 [Candidatus Enterosoma sp.]|nr:hypothetical protein [Candidatus Enterosoma sp.]MDY3081037.1 hypothetical protein [Candidatus Enterosoma sp.]